MELRSQLDVLRYKYTSPNVTDRSFTIPMSSVDISYNPLLMEEPEDYDLSTLSF